MSVRKLLASRRKLVMIGAGLSLCTLAVPSGLAFANAANPCGAALTAGVCPPNNAGGSGTEQVDPSTGHATITLSGYWTWAGCSVSGSSKCSPQVVAKVGPNGCLNSSGQPARVGVGWAIIWNDPNDPGYSVNKSGFNVGATGANGLNPQDDTAHMQAGTPCGPLDQSGLVAIPGKSGQFFPSGQWGPISHVYASAADVPSKVCVNMYDPHQGRSAKEFIAGGPNANGDNSIQTNAFNPAMGGGSCFSPIPVVTPKGALAGHIYDCTGNATQTTTEELGGSITFAGQGARSNPVSLSNIPVGSYGATALAPAGFHFVQCASTDYTIANGTATYVNPVAVPANGTGTAIFFVAPNPPPPTTAFVVKKTVSPSGSVPINTTLTYTVTVKNTGQTAGSPSDPLQDVLQITGGATYNIVNDATADKGTVTNTGNGTWSWDLTKVNFASGDVATLHVTIKALTPGTITNAAILPGSNCPPNSSTPDSDCGTNTPVNLVLTKTNSPDDSAPIAVGTKVHYTITLTNPTDNDAVDVPMTDVMSGTATSDVDQQSFMSTANVIPTCQNTACTTFTWSWTIHKHSAETLTYDATITSPGTSSSSIGSLTMVNTVSTPGLPPVTVQNHTPPSEVKGITTGTPSTGGFSEMNITVAGFMFLGGLGLILSGALARQPKPRTQRTR